jgi:hypothetical protein
MFWADAPMLKVVNTAAATTLQTICFFIALLSNKLFAGVLYHFYRQSMQALVNEILQRIIHKPVPRHPRNALKLGTANAHPKVRTKARVIRPHMACMGSALI